ncbi:hypothetical protein [Propionivibrio limicola]|uniref:hypothetical protein n=1 Tax=Propionivibrio limicola TaxID=167645 RepID=UPI0012919B52|nr:hypothetical protein [Propionivibrio limicola]
MNISWFFGFGWISVLTAVAAGVGINLLSGPVVWILYIPFLLAALHMTARFKRFNTDRWRRIHARAMLTYRKLAEQEFDAAKNENREYDILTPCRALGEQMFAQTPAVDVATLLTDESRKTYYKQLVDAYPNVFVQGIKPERHDAILNGVRSDIDASKLGPDILIAKAIELKHNQGEAANYLHALLLGKVQ